MTIFFGLHYFVYKSLTHSLVQASGMKRGLKWFFWLSGLSFIVSMVLSRGYNIHFLNHYAYTWLGVIAIAFSFFLVQRILALIFDRHARTLSIITLALVALVSIYSLINGLSAPVVKRLTIPIKKLPAELNQFKLIHLSDLHLESYKSKGVIKKIVDQVNELQPDLVVLTGDIIDGGAAGEPLFCKELKRIKSKYGVIATAGNHEYYVGMKTFSELAQCAGITILDNKSITIADSLQIIGLDDDEGFRFEARGPKLDEALKHCDKNKPMILLYHRPLRFAEAVSKGIDLQLSGHTHAGQIPPMDLLVQIVYKYPFGLYEKEGSYIYTTSGTGYWGPAMRFLSKNEIVLFTLESR
jgi:predicted MPP superfamily phosphohydrolase